MTDLRDDITAVVALPDTIGLADLGFGDRERALFASFGGDLEPARVVRVDRGMPLVASGEGIERAEQAMHLIKTADEPGSRIVVGDWVALGRPPGHEMPLIEAILPRASYFTRKDPGEQTGEQVVIANVDVVFVIQSLSGDGVNVRRLERELVMAWESGATPVVVLTKADLSADLDSQRDLAMQVSPGVDVIVESAVTGEGIDEVRSHVPPGKTAALLGGSGVGKSTLVNRLLGADVLETAEVRAGDDKGRHTTVAREMVLVPGGGIIIDTPGMRSLGLWDADSGLAQAFSDVDRLAQGCRFRDCRHEAEPGCAVVAAVEAGELDAARLASYRKLRAELDMVAERQETRARQEKKRADRILAKTVKRYYTQDGGKKEKGRQ